MQIGNGFSPEQDDNSQMNYRASTSRSARGDVECLDMEIVIGDQKEMIQVYPDSDINALAQEFAAQHNLSQEYVEQLRDSIQQNYNMNFLPQQ